MYVNHGDENTGQATECLSIVKWERQNS
jgi:hypothetical protein